MAKNVLIADDEDTIVEYLLAIMIRAGWTASIVRTGREMYSLMTSLRSNYDLVITDIRMPNLNGVDGTKLAEAFGVHIPTLYISGYSDYIDLPESEILLKPFTLKELDERIKGLLGKDFNTGLI